MKLTDGVTLVLKALTLLAVVFTALLSQTSLAHAEEDDPAVVRESVIARFDAGLVLKPIRTSSPRETFESFLLLRGDLETTAFAYRYFKTRAEFAHIQAIFDEMADLIDLSTVPTAVRNQIGGETVVTLLDILGRIDPPDLSAVPDLDALAEEGPAVWRIPGTPLRIERILDGPRQDEFLFSSRTVVTAPRFFSGIEAAPLRSELNIESWTRALPQFTGYLIPGGLVDQIPLAMRELWFDTPIWKVVTIIVVGVGGLIVLVLWHRVVIALRPKGLFRSIAVYTLTPIAIIAATHGFDLFKDYQLFTAGRFDGFLESFTTVIAYIAKTWLFWLVATGIAEWFILSPRINSESLDASLLRIAARSVGFVGGVAILAIGADQLGLPVYSLLAGLGIGGLAVALAVRPSLENLIGGLMLYTDKPVRVGDFCEFAGFTGTVEAIGVRSTRIRTLDRTLISVPNAKFADNELINWARCDQMLINEIIGLRYETSSDQLRHVLARLRRMAHAHPRIDNETIRIRFAGYGDFSLNIDMRIYAQTREWNDYFAIKEDVLMRVYDIVESSGTGFAFPSQTLYLGRDAGMDQEKGRKAEAEVGRWRRFGQLPFPRMAKDEIERLEDTLDYPPRGSVERHGVEEFHTEKVEGLSAEAAPGEAELEAKPEPLSGEEEKPRKRDAAAS